MGNKCCYTTGSIGSQVVPATDTADPQNTSGAEKVEEPQTEPAAGTDSEPARSNQRTAFEPVLNWKRNLNIKLYKNESDALDNKGAANLIVWAWYGDPTNEWHGKGKDVTCKVEQCIKKGKVIKPDTKVFGSPVPQVSKVLFLEMYTCIVYGSMLFRLIVRSAIRNAIFTSPTR